MKKIINIQFILLGMILLFCGAGKAQQQAMFTQYMFNTLAINPAYAGTHETLSATAHFRSQWAGFDGAPKTQSFSAHGPLRKDNVALGLMILHDKVGVTSVTTFSPSYAYRIHHGSKGILSLGLQANLTNARSKFSELSPTEGNDVALNQDVNKWYPNFGVGAYWYTQKYYAGISMPMILKNDFSTDADIDGDDAGAGEMRPYFALTGGYLFEISDNFVLKPSMMMRTNYGAPMTVDLNANAYFIEALGIGVSYRWKESVAAIAEIFLTEDIRIGYSYDIILNDINEAATGSHEIMINYKFPFSKKRIVTPRYF
ncbi:type IX secretion system membrane protein PorP/SprF [Carboxylicivirga sp. A043]|uniref:PorP/SprF family type IX secretion system membrane protein n=1 Tax=Carboxylicivirga litoralis TaxID=2816963 RepID=UPI0021CB7B1D|nr:type IX secretion system membrane protein PorP/SprF [Carboxylicivirga sp. A043]MCU4155242.1 type IX secretion system membrane protein PorP/SprF [Carboxylicivirga sp. A043]